MHYRRTHDWTLKSQWSIKSNRFENESNPDTDIHSNKNMKNNSLRSKIVVSHPTMLQAFLPPVPVLVLLWNGLVIAYYIKALLYSTTLISTSLFLRGQCLSFFVSCSIHCFKTKQPSKHIQDPIFFITNQWRLQDLIKKSNNLVPNS